MCVIVERLKNKNKVKKDAIFSTPKWDNTKGTDWWCDLFGDKYFEYFQSMMNSSVTIVNSGFTFSHIDASQLFF